MLWEQINSLLKSSNFRFTLLSLILIWISLVLVLVVMNYMTRVSIERVLEWQMNSDEEIVLDIIQNAPKTNIVDILSKAKFQTGTVIFYNGTALNPDADQRFEPERYDKTDITLSRQINLTNDQIIVLTRRVSWLKELYRVMNDTMVLGITITFLLAIVISYILARRNNRRIRQINAFCDAIIDGDLDRRIPISDPSKPDDYDQVSQNLNEMLDQIQALMSQVRQVSDNIAHDLRSSLTRLRARLEKICLDDGNEELAASIKDADKLLEMFNSLLSIARLEAAELNNGRSVNMSATLHDACEFYEPVFNSKGIQLNTSIAEGEIIGDENLLFQALSNLLDNAAKYTPDHGLIEVKSYSEDNLYIIEIMDSGSGIDVNERNRVFERFVRLDDARTLPGYGLGLSQVKAIIELHKGEVKLSNNNGLTVRLTFPMK